MRPIVLFAVIAAILLFAPGCKAATITMKAVQTYSEPYQFYADGSLNGQVAANSTYIAVDAAVQGNVAYYAPLEPLGPPVKAWEKTLDRGTGQRAYKVIFSSEEGQDWIQIVSCTWEEARTSLVHLPAPDETAAANYDPNEKTARMLVYPKKEPPSAP